MKHKNIPLNERIIFALDVDSYEEAEKWVDRLGSHINFYKVGLQLFMGGWFPVIDMITKHGHKVMVDLKIFDVPETVKLALRQLRDRNITFATVHGNDPILRAAVGEKNDVQILSVTVLTSFDEEDMREMGFSGTIEDWVFVRAKRALSLGCDGIISSGLEVPRLRDAFGDNFLVVTPGIRPGKNVEIPEDDQKRIVTAQDAIINGADYVVVGRPISKAQDPIAVVESMQSEIRRRLVKYTPKRGSITVSVTDAGNEVRVTVADTGIGIPREHLNRIFERFYRVDKNRSRELGGTGLGLSVVKHIVQNNGGRVWVQSELEGGSAFSFSLPKKTNRNT
jgi:orotidine 5''-phosphate decarboxylase, subfamily 1